MELSDMKWKIIEDNPPLDDVVLVFGEVAGEIYGKSGVRGITIAYYSGEEGDYEGFNWMCVPSDAYAVWVRPTHWMPLPNEPV
jgi:hypothetical protein